VSKDNLLFALAGLLLGFVSSYLMFEAMSARQPPRRAPGAPFAGEAAGAAAAMPGAEGAGEAAGAAGAEAQGTPPGMEEIRKLRDYVAEHPDDADAVLQLANLNYNIQNWARARDLYTQYLKLRPDQPDVLTDLGITYRETGDPKGALRFFDRAQQVAPDHWQSRFNEVVVLAFDLEDYAAAEQELVELKRLQPANQDVARLEAEVAKRKAA
jgi:tetratricopeptide (TPR) repeat protein